MTDENNIVYLPEHAPGGQLARGELPEAFRSSGSVESGVAEAMGWLRDHPGADYLDAAAAVAYGHGGELSQSGWPELVGRVREEAARIGPLTSREMEETR